MLITICVVAVAAFVAGMAFQRRRQISFFPRAEALNEIETSSAPELAERSVPALPAPPKSSIYGPSGILVLRGACGNGKPALLEKDGKTYDVNGKKLDEVLLETIFVEVDVPLGMRCDSCEAPTIEKIYVVTKQLHWEIKLHCVARYCSGCGEDQGLDQATVMSRSWQNLGPFTAKMNLFEVLRLLALEKGKFAKRLRWQRLDAERQHHHPEIVRLEDEFRRVENGLRRTPSDDPTRAIQEAHFRAIHELLARKKPPYNRIVEEWERLRVELSGKGATSIDPR